jgi:hypothetical protein
LLSIVSRKKPGIAGHVLWHSGLLQKWFSSGSCSQLAG